MAERLPGVTDSDRAAPRAVLALAGLFFFQSCATPTPAAAPDAAARRAAEAAALLQSVIEGGRVAVPGVAGSVFKDGVEVYRGAAGLADVAEGIEAEPDTRFRIYSTSKALTAAAAFSLAERGVLDLDAPIGRYMPDLPADKHPITTRQLLAHRGGIRHYREGEWLSVSSRQCSDPIEALPDFIDDPLIHAPGTETRYTSFGYVLVSAVLQAAARAPYADVMEQTVFAPAGMESMAVEGAPVDGYPIADFYNRKEDESSPFVSTSLKGVNASCKFGGGGFVGRATDLAAFGAALANGRIISARSLADMTTVITPAPEDGSRPPMGYGIFAEDPFPGFPDTPKNHTARAFWHGGSARGGYSVLIAYPDEGVSVGLVSNVNAGGWLIFKTHDLARIWWEDSELSTP